jgi:hypothetical protein
MKVPEEGGFPCYHPAGGFTARTQLRQQQSLVCHYLAGVLFLPLPLKLMQKFHMDINDFRSSWHEQRL